MECILKIERKVFTVPMALFGYLVQ
jgi:hypothetical protein